MLKSHLKFLYSYSINHIHEHSNHVLCLIGVSAAASPAPPPIGITAAAAAPPPKKKTTSPNPKTAKSKLKEYFEAQGKQDVVKYNTIPEGSGFRSTVTCPKVGRTTGEQQLSKKDAEHSAAQRALDKL